MGRVVVVVVLLLLVVVVVVVVVQSMVHFEQFQPYLAETWGNAILRRTSVNFRGFCGVRLG